MVHNAVHPEFLESRKRPVELGQVISGPEFSLIQHRTPFAFIDDEGGLYMGFYRGQSEGELLIQSDRSGRFTKLPARQLAKVIPISRRRPSGLSLAINARLDSENQQFLRADDLVLLYVMDDSEPMVYRFLNRDTQGNLIFQEPKASGETPAVPRILSPGVFDMDGFGILMDRAPHTTP